MCERIKILRQSLLRTLADKRVAEDAWQSVKSTLEEILREKDNDPNHMGWIRAQDEVTLIAREAQIHEVKAMLAKSLSTMEFVYKSLQKRTATSNIHKTQVCH